MVVLSACNQTYSNLRRAEDRLIANYISRNQLNIMYEEPEATMCGRRKTI